MQYTKADSVPFLVEHSKDGDGSYFRFYARYQPPFKRLDVFLSKSKCLAFSRSKVQAMIRAGAVKVNNAAVKPNLQIKTGDTIELWHTDAVERDGINLPENIPVDIIHEDEFLLVINKNPGIVVHPAAGNRSGTLVNALLYHCDMLSEYGGNDRPGIVHRLDKDTSGVMVVAKNDLTHRLLSEQFANRLVKKKYLALASGRVAKNSFMISLPIGRDINDRKKISGATLSPRESTTGGRVLERVGRYTLVELSPKTGRTHQLRVHLKHIGHPIIGDKVYGNNKTDKAGGITVDRQLLHALTLSFRHPHSEEEVCFNAPMHKDFQEVLDTLQFQHKP